MNNRRLLENFPNGVSVEPHTFKPRGWRWWVCNHCFWPRTAHPVHFWAVARPLGDTRRMDYRGAADLEFAAKQVRGSDPATEER